MINDIESISIRINEKRKHVNKKKGPLRLSNRGEERKRMKKSEENLCDLWDTIKRCNRQINEVLEELRQKRVKSLFKEINV